jgi:hypothetical protein
VVGRRGMEGLCPGSTLADMSPDTAARVLYGIDSGCILPNSVECTRGVISRVWAARPVARLTEQIRDVRMSIPPIMLQFLSSEGEARDVGRVSACSSRDSFQLSYVSLVVPCGYGVDGCSFVRLKPELLGKMMYLELRQSANVRFYPEPTNAEIYSGFHRDLEILVARKGVREDGFRNFQDIAPYLVSWTSTWGVLSIVPSTLGTPLRSVNALGV